MSSETLFSAHWHRVKNLKPRLAADVNIVRQMYRGRPYWVLHRRATSSFHRLDIASFELVDRLDGTLTIAEVWEQAILQRSSNAPTQDDWLNVLASLQSAELLRVDRRVSAESLFERREEGRSRRRRERWQNPLFLRFSLLDPDSWLTPLTPLANVLFSRMAFVVWAVLMVAGLIALLLSGASILQTISSPQYPSPDNALLLFLVYPPLKLLHELGHALAVKRGGGEVHDTGIALMVLVPLPYVNASASAAFPDKRSRMLVAAAGILVELAVAAIGVLLWAMCSGVVADIGLALFLVGGLSTVLINGNPLLRFDGYYLFAEVLEIPNLTIRARAAVLSKFKSLLCGQSDPESECDDRAERYWLIGYGLASAIYRTGLMLWISWWLSGRFLIFGALLAMYTVTTSFVLPACRALRAVVREPELHAPRPLLLVSGIPFAVIAAVFWLPLPQAYVARGVIWLPDDAVVRAQSSCNVTRATVQQGAEVAKGQPLFDCIDPELALRERELVARSDVLSALQADLAINNPAEFDRLESERNANELALNELRVRARAGFHRAELQGWFDAPGSVSLEGRSFVRGDIVAYVVPKTHRTVRVALTQTVASRLDSDLRRIELLTHSPLTGNKVFLSTVVSKTPRASLEVPSAALSTVGGGEHHADPSGDGRQLLEPVFNVELTWPEQAGTAPVGSHIPVRFIHPPAPIAGRITNAIRRVMSERDRA